MFRTCKRLVLLVAPILFAGCASPFAQPTGIDWSGKPGLGTITVSDPKEYRREALINERNNEAAWLDQLLESSKTIEFKPEINREVEQIATLSHALGLSLDPSARLSYKRSRDTGDLQQQIDVTSLQLQLDQLKHDADNVRAKFATQDQPVNTDLGKATIAAPTAPPSTTAVAAVDQLKAAVDKLSAALTGRLDADGKAATPTNTTPNPADLFRDRSAYRDLLKSARNAASLDELHDADGAALMRLNFHATVFPDREKSRVPGVIQATVRQHLIDANEEQRVYAGWLDYLNSQLNIDDGQGWRTNPDLLRTAVTDLFDTVQFRYPTSTNNVPAVGGAKSVKSGVSKASSVCGGLVVDLSLPADPKCATLVFAAAKMQGASPEEGASSDIEKYFDAFHVQVAEQIELRHYVQARKTLSLRAADLVSDCGLPHPAMKGAIRPGEVNDLYLELELARIRVVGGSQLLAIQDRARRMLTLRSIATPQDPRVQTIFDRTRRAEALLDTLETFAYAHCTPDQRRAYRETAGQLFVPNTFKDALARSGPVSVYEVGPRDLVQQVSTVARSANSLALAVSIAAAMPGSGAAANAAGGYSRQAMGRAAVLERVPAVVGYSLQGVQTFGWVFGPLATVNPAGRLELDQSLREYDLTVDLSVPSWWPSFDIETTTQWAPQARDIASGGLTSAPVRSHVRRTLNTADYAVLTSQVANKGVAVPRRAAFSGIGLAGQTLYACRPTALVVRGDNLWRANVVLLNGTKLGAGVISVAPDMSGLLIDVPATGDLLGDFAGPQVRVTLLTPYGDASAMADYVRAPATGCKAAGKKPPDEPSVASVTPTSFRAPSAPQFQVTGAKLDEVTRVTLNGQEGKVETKKGGKSLKVTFTSDQTLGLPVSRTVPLTFFKGDDRVADATVEVTENGGSK